MASSTPQPLCEHTTIKTIHHVNKTKQNKISKTLQHTVKCEKKRVVECDLGSLQSWRIDFFCKSGGTVLPLFAQLSCLSEHDLPVMQQSGQRSHPPALGSTGTPPSDHAHAPLWTRSTSAQRNSFSNFPWLRKQYTCLNNVDISNALKHSRNGALIGCKWIQDGKHSVGDPALYHGLLDL